MFVKEHIVCGSFSGQVSTRHRTHHLQRCVPARRPLTQPLAGAILEYVWPLLARYTFADWLLTQSTYSRVTKTPITQINGYMTEYTSGCKRMGEWRLRRKWWPGRRWGIGVGVSLFMKHYRLLAPSRYLIIRRLTVGYSTISQKEVEESGSNL